MKDRIRIASIVPVLALAGCASYGPLDTAEFEPTLRRDVPVSGGKILFKAPASLFYGVDGYKPGDSLAVKSPVLAQGSYESGEGIVVLTEEKLYFVRWWQEKYARLWDLDYAKIRSLEIRSLGAGRRLVIKFHGDLEVASLDVTTDGGKSMDPQRTVTVCQLLAQGAMRECRIPAG